MSSPPPRASLRVGAPSPADASCLMSPREQLLFRAVRRAFAPTLWNAMKRGLAGEKVGSRRNQHQEARERCYTPVWTYRDSGSMCTSSMRMVRPWR